MAAEGVRRLKILHIEDEPRSVRQTGVSINRIFPSAEVRVAETLEEAKQAMAESSFDLAICDLRIGLNSGSLGANEVHGIAAYHEVRAQAPGTPVLFLSAFATLQNTTDLTAGGGISNAFGILDFQMTKVIEKGQPRRLEDYLLSIRNGIDELDKCQVAGASALDPMFTRAVQIFGRSIMSTSATVTPMNGLSRASVGLVRYSQAPHNDVAVVVKLDSHGRMRSEIDNYNLHVGPRLLVGTFAPQIQIMRSGLRGRTAVVSSLASPSSRSLFSRLAESESVDITKVQATLDPWNTIGDRTTTTVGDYRRTVISDDELKSLSTYCSDLLAADHLPIEVAWKLAHGDFHGENILIDDQGAALVIDFADCATLPAGLDAAALELSLLCHPKSPFDQIWPTAPCSSWSNVDDFVADSPWASEVRQIRAWAIAEAGEVQAVAVYLGQACWLMKHGGTGAERAKLVALSAVSRLLEIGSRPTGSGA